jgi:hypothetical protein
MVKASGVECKYNPYINLYIIKSLTISFSSIRLEVLQAQNMESSFNGSGIAFRQ